jgi:hypothetical protein
MSAPPRGSELVSLDNPSRFGYSLVSPASDLTISANGDRAYVVSSGPDLTAKPGGYNAAVPVLIRSIVNRLSTKTRALSSTTVRRQLPVEDVVNHLPDCGICLLYFKMGCGMRRLEYPENFIGKSLLN